MAYFVFDNGEALEVDYDATAYGDAKRVTKAAYLRAKQAYAVAQLLKILKPGDTLYTAADGKAHRVLAPACVTTGARTSATSRISSPTPRASGSIVTAPSSKAEAATADRSRFATA